MGAEDSSSVQRRTSIPAVDTFRKLRFVYVEGVEVVKVGYLMGV